MRFVIVGGSGSATPEFAEALAAWPGGSERRPPIEVVLVSRSADRLELVAGEMRRRVADLGGAEVSIVAETDLRVALDGADVVLNAVRIGGLDARVFDESFPQSRGVPGEETMGPGGFANALRTVPAVIPIWQAVAEHAPDALLINLTNPSGIVVTAIQRALDLPIFSICDSPVAFCDKIAERLGVMSQRIRRRYQGMNHMGWWTPEDEAQLETAIDLADGQEPEAVRVQAAIGAPYVRYYVHPQRILENQRAAGEVRAQQLQRLEAELLSGYSARDTQLPRRGAVWYELAVLPLVDAWFNGSQDIITVGMRNDGRIPGLPDDVVTEGPIRIEKPGQVESLPLEPLPHVPATMLAQHAAFESLAAAAATPDATREDHVRALMANPMVRSYDLAAALVDDIEAGSPA